MEIVNGSNAQTEIVTLACKAKPGVDAGNYSVMLAHGGQTFKLKAGQAIRVPRVRAAFFLGKSERWDANNPLMLEIIADEAKVVSADEDERESLIEKVIELGLASGRREAKKLTTDELKALVSQAG